MKKKTITIGALLLAMTSFSQIDTLAYSINGKEKCKFNNYTSEIIQRVTFKEYQDFEFKLKKNEFLWLGLFDDIKRDTLYLLYRDVSVYYRDSSIEKYYYNSNRNTITVDGNFVRKIVVHKPELK